MAITGARMETSDIKFYCESDIESLKSRCWFRRLTTFFKPKTSGLRQYLLNLISHDSHSYNRCSTEKTYYCKTDVFKFSFSGSQALNGIRLMGCIA